MARSPLSGGATIVRDEDASPGGSERPGAQKTPPTPLGLRLVQWLRVNWVSAAIGVLLVWLIAAPMGLLINMSFRDGTPATPTEFTLDNYAQVYGSSVTYSALLNTVIYAGAVTVISLSLAAVCAWLIERTDMPGRNFAWVMMLIPMAMPGLLSAMAWILLASPEIGIVNVWTRNLLQLFGVQLESGPFNIYSLEGMIWVEGLKGTSTLFLMIVGAFRLMDPSLEGAATMCGASRWTTLRRVTLPLMFPALLAASIYAFLGNLEDFDTPLLLGLRGGVFILPTLIYFEAYIRPGSGWGLASAYTSIFLVLMFVLIAYYYLVVVKRAKNFATVRGKGFRPDRIKLGKWRWPAFGFVFGFFFLVVLLPLGTLVYASLQPIYLGPTWSAFSNFSLENYREIFQDPAIIKATSNTVIIGVGTGFLTVGIAFAVSWVVIRGKTRGRMLMDAMAFAPNAIPAVALALGMIILYLSPFGRWIPIYGTLFMITLALGTKYLAYTTRLGNSAMLQISMELEEAAWMSGAGRFRAFRRVTLPLLLPTIAAGWLWVAAHAFRNLTIPLLIATPGTETIALRMFFYWERQADFPLTAAIGVLLIAVLTLMAFASRKFIVRGFTGD